MNKTIIIDNGTRSIRAGYSGDSKPIIFPNIVCRHRLPQLTRGVGNNVYIGDDVMIKTKKGILSIKHPIENGVIVQWDDIERIWDYTFKKLDTSSNGQSVLLTEPIINPEHCREKTTQIMFESFEIDSLYIGIQPVLSLYECGKTTGFVLESTESVTNTIAIQNGNPILSSVLRFNLAGRDLTYYLMKMLGERGYCFNTSAEFDLIGNVKNELSYVAHDFNKEMVESTSTTNTNKSFTLPDGSTFNIGNELFRCPESMFQPLLYGLEIPGIQNLIQLSIKKCDENLQNQLYNNILLKGGNTMFAGFSDRLKKELSLLQPQTDINITPSKNDSSWIGGSMISLLSNFNEMCMSKNNYNEFGPYFVHSKFHHKLN